VDAAARGGKIVRRPSIPRPIARIARIARIDMESSMLRSIPLPLAVLSLAAVVLLAPPREDIAYVASAPANLLGLADPAAPKLAEILPGCALRVVQRKNGMARIELEGWVAEGAIAAAPPFPVAGAAPKPEPADRDQEPVADLALAQRIEVSASTTGTGDAARFVIAATLRTLKGAPVVVAGAKQSGTVTVYAQRRIAGQRTRGDVLLERALPFDAGRASVEFKPEELVLPAGVRELLISARAELPGARVVVGAAVDVPCGGS
jgi:hypothetical protein